MSCEDGENCPVSDKLCAARMATVHEEIKGIKQTIRTTIQTSAAIIGIVLAVLEIVLRFA